ncbi:MAG: alpha/beta fold hydrolase [Rhizobiales bacterium]|nr:alpha/beta fold hydrolase [Hyphomicrobiales bacterium]
MDRIEVRDGVRLFVSDQGPRDAPAIVFAHEFGGDWRTWDRQVARFSDRYRCIRYCARGFLPSDVPDPAEAYGQVSSTNDLTDVIEAFDLDAVHLVGCSMGSFTSITYAMENWRRLRTLTLVGCSSGPRDEAERARYRNDITREIGLMESRGSLGAVEWFANDAAYQRVNQKAPAAWREYLANLGGQSVDGAIRTLRTVHWNRKSLFDMAPELASVETPTLLAFGEEDHYRIAPTNEFLSATMPNTHVLRIPETGHLVHVEEADRFNTELERHLTR